MRRRRYGWTIKRAQREAEEARLTQQRLGQQVRETRPFGRYAQRGELAGGGLERAVDEEDGCEARVERAERLRRPARGAAARTRRDLEADEHAQRAGESKL